MRKIQEKLIENIFKGILDIETIVLDLTEDEDLNFAIYNRNILPKSLFNVSVKEYTWDYGIFEEDGKWSFSVMEHNYGSYDEPSSSEPIDSPEWYSTFDDTLQALIMRIVNENYSIISEETYYLTHDEEFGEYVYIS